MTIQDIHRKAIEEADKAFYYKSDGENSFALAHFKKAFLLEREAALIARQQKIGEPTESVLLRSAAALAIHAKNYSEANELINMGLGNKPTREIIEELNDLCNDSGFQDYNNKKKKAQTAAYQRNVSLQQQLLDAGVHFGHLKKKWNPKMLQFIFAEKKGIHIIDLNRTVETLFKAAAAVKSLARNGKKILFVGTKKQAQQVVKQAALRIGMPYVTEKWLGGMLVNFNTVRKSIKKMQALEQMLLDGSFDSRPKKERLTLSRDVDKMEKVLGGLTTISRIPSAIFIIDIGHEHTALAEAKRMGITSIGMVDTNCDPSKVDFPIPANDDSTTSIAIIVNYIANAIQEGQQEKYNKNDDENIKELDTELQKEIETRSKKENRRVKSRRLSR